MEYEKNLKSQYLKFHAFHWTDFYHHLSAIINHSSYQFNVFLYLFAHSSATDILLLHLFVYIMTHFF